MDHAIVIGAGMAGLLSAAALHRRYGRVTVLDRDTLPTLDVHRRGAGQSRHAHALLARGREVIENLLPGLTGELVALGAIQGDLQARTRWVHAGRPLARAQSGLDGLFVSRPLLEGQTRRRVAGLQGVAVRSGQTVSGLLATRGRVTGVRLDSGEVLAADLVVDASGRGSRAPEWLSGLGFPPPGEEQVTIGLRYGTREFRREPDSDLAVLIAPTADIPRAGVALALEGDRWIVTMASYGGDGPPLDLDGFVAYAAGLPAPDLHRLLREADPVGEPRAWRIPASVRRRYERLTRLPDGLLVTGDAVCSANPLYGHGMTVAALEARSMLEPDLSPRAFFRRIGALIDGPWDIATAGDLRLPGVSGRLTPKARLINAYLDRFHAAAVHDPDLALRFLRVANLIDPPPALLGARPLLRVFRSGAPRAVPALA